MMTHRERFLTAINHQEADMVPVSAVLDTKFVELLTGQKASSLKVAYSGPGSDGKGVNSPVDGNDRKTFLRTQ